MHVAVVDVPTVGPFGVTAAGKLGHATLKRGTWRKATPERDAGGALELCGAHTLPRMNRSAGDASIDRTPGYYGPLS